MHGNKSSTSNISKYGKRGERGQQKNIQNLNLFNFFSNRLYFLYMGSFYSYHLDLLRQSYGQSCF